MSLLFQIKQFVMDKKHCWIAQLLVTLLVLNEMNWTHASIGQFIIAELYHLSCAIALTINVLFTSHLNCNYHSWGLINDMQMSIYNRKHWHALSHSLHFVRHEGDWRPTHPSQRVSRVPDYLYSIQSVLGLFQVRLIPHTLL